jgi:alginate O-acetyltransferase complex protein AlgI
MTLTRWFRDYLYIPLGGNRMGATRTYVNLAVVFVLCGLWHGAAYTFILWGLFHGAFLAGERIVLHRWQAKPGGYLGQLYTLVAVSFGWVLFRATDLMQAGAFFRQMLFVGGQTDAWVNVRQYLPADQLFYLLLGIVLAVFPVGTALGLARFGNAGLALKRVGTIALFILAVANLSEGTFRPFIYFRF